MKKLLLSLTILASGLVYHNAQAQVYKQGNVIIDAYYGFPNLYTSYIKGVYDNDNGSTYTNLSVSSLGPLGANAEYLISDRIGIGAEFTYASTNAKFDYNDADYGWTHVNLDITRLRILPRVNIHFNGGDKLDPYLALGMGYKDVRYNYTYSNSGANDHADFRNFIPISTRAGFGIRYFFIPNLGFNLEFGFGGAMLRGGLSAKF